MAVFFKGWGITLMCCLLASPVMAENSNHWNSSLVFSAGQSTMTNACTSPWIFAGSACSDNGTAYRLAYIYHFNPTWGLEISAGDFGHAKAYATLQASPAVNYDWHLHATGLAIAGVGTMHLGDSISVFGKAGVARTHFQQEWRIVIAGVPMDGISLNGVDITNRGMNNFTYGAGIQYDFNRDFALRAQYENFGSYDIYSEYGTLGLNNVPGVNVEISLLSVGFVISF